MPLRNRPLRLRNRLLIGFAACCLICVIANPFTSRSTPRILIGSFAICAGLLCLTGAAFTQLDVRSYARLQDPANQIAKWKISPQTWQAFQPLNDYWNNAKGVYPNALDTKQQPPLEVIATRRAVLVGDDFYDIGNTCTRRVERIGLTEAQPHCIEVCGLAAGKNTSYPFALRFPIDPANRFAADRLINAWREEYLKPPSRNVARPRNICLAISFCGLAAMIAAWRFAGSFNRMIETDIGGLFAAGLLLFLIPLAIAAGYQARMRQSG